MVRSQTSLLEDPIGVRKDNTGPGKSPRPTMTTARRQATIILSLAASDFLAALTALCLAPLLVTSHVVTSTCVLEAVSVVALSALAGLYSSLCPSPIERIRMRVFAAAALCAISFAVSERSITGIVEAVLNGALLLAFGHYAELACRTLLERAGIWSEHVLIVGDGPRCERLVRDLTSQKLLGMKPVAVLAPGATVKSIPARGDGSGIPIVASLSELTAPVETAIAVSPLALQSFEMQPAGSGRIGRVLLLADGTLGESLWIATRSLGTGIGVEVRRSMRLDRSPGLKRLLDIALATLALPPIALVVLICVVLVKQVDPGPAFYVQRRIGRNGRQVDVLKIRTMYCDAERRLEQHLKENSDARAEWQQFFKLRNDPRILPAVGGILRKFSLDELPQIWNVIKGEMSLVGPRPFPEYHLRMFDEEFQSLRTSVPPGLTGMWQISTRSDGDLDMQKAEDLFYIRNRSIWLDLFIILQTIPAMLSARGAR